MNTNPILLIVLGPTGSGKGSLPKKVSNYLGLNDRLEHSVKILIDDLVEEQENYKKFVIGNIKSYGNNREKLFNSFLNPTENKLWKYSKAYFKSRKEGKCKPNINLSCNKLNDQIFQNALQKEMDVVIELTGEYYVSWIFEYYGKLLKNKYNIIFAWSTAPICELLKRNKLRALLSVIEFAKNQNKPAPRLPNTTYKSYKKKLEKIMSIFMAMTAPGGYISKLQDFNKRVLVFDNTNTETKVIYDQSSFNYNGPMNKYKINNSCVNNKVKIPTNISSNNKNLIEKIISRN